MAPQRLDELAAELERLSEQLADAAMDLLRVGLAEGTEAASARATTQERLVNRARSSLEKAVNLLAQASSVPLGAVVGAGPPGDDSEDFEEPPSPARHSRGPEPAPWDTP